MGLKHRPPLDGIRGLAILGVLVLHATIWGAMPPVIPGGNLGVTVFFVLSGYLITSLLLSEHDRVGRIDLRAFYLRRAARLLPGLFVLLPVYVVVFSRHESAWQLVLMVGPVLLYLSCFVQAIWGAMGPLGWTWSLSVEEHFYVCWPPALRRLLSARRERGGVRGWVGRHPLVVAGAAALLIVAVASGVRVSLAGSFRWNVFAYYSTPTRIDALAVGAVAALLGHCYRAAVPRLAGWAAILTIGWCYANPEFSIGEDALNLYGLPLCEIATAVLILSVVGHPSSLLARALSWRPLVHLGVVSYGLYLWNLLPGQAFTLIAGRHPGVGGTLILLAGIFVAVEISYWCVERPVMRWARARLAAPRTPGGVRSRRRSGVPRMRVAAGARDG